jgi:hypothetical protein
VVFSGYSGFLRHHDITETLLKVALNTITLTLDRIGKELRGNGCFCFVFYCEARENEIFSAVGQTPTIFQDYNILY